MTIVSRLQQWLIQALPIALRTLSCLFLVTCVIVGSVQAAAIAAPNAAADIELSRAASELDRVKGKGTSDQLQGKVQENLGTAKRAVGKVTGQTEGTVKELKGRAQQGLGRTQEALDEAGNAIEDSRDSLADSVKRFFGK